MSITPKLTINLLDGAMIEREGPFVRHTHVGIVENIDTSNDWLVLDKAFSVDGMPKMGDGHPSNDGTIFWRLRAVPLTDNAAKVVLVYEKPLLNFTPTAYVIRERGWMTDYESEFLPGPKRQPLFLTYEYYVESQDSSGKTTKTKASLTDAARYRGLRPMRIMNISGLKYGKPPEKFKLGNGKVNDAQWQNLDKGFWLMTEYQTDVARFQGYYTYSASALTKLNESWNEGVILENKLTGKRVPIDPDPATATKIAADWLNKPYEYGFFPLTYKGLQRGFARVGQYETTNFQQLFGF